MLNAAKVMDDGFTKNEFVRLENSALVMSPIVASTKDEEYKFLDEQFKKRMEQTGILDVIGDTCNYPSYTQQTWMEKHIS